MNHHRYGLLLRPMDQVGRRGVADYLVIPARGPHHVEHSVGSHADTRIAHESVVADPRFEKRLVVVDSGPGQSVG